MHDIVISGGAILGGTGAPAFAGDVAIRAEPIVAVGGKARPARRVIDADGYGHGTGARPGRLVRAGR